MTKLPVPEQWTLAKLTDREVSEEIERRINYVDENGRSVRLPMEFVRHYTTRHDNVLPTIVAIATLPIVLADGGILGMEMGFDRQRGISFIIPKEVMALVPRREDATPAAVAAAIEVPDRRVAGRCQDRLWREVQHHRRRPDHNREIAAGSAPRIHRHCREEGERQDHLADHADQGHHRDMACGSSMVAQ